MVQSIEASLAQLLGYTSQQSAEASAAELLALVQQFNAAGGVLPFGRSATKVVTHPAASALRQAQADYVLGGPDINAAIAAAGAGKVELTEGEFSIAGVIDAISSGTLQGQGFGTVVKNSTTGLAALLRIKGDVTPIANVMVKDIWFDGDNTGGKTQNYLIRLTGTNGTPADCKNILIDGCYFNDANVVAVGNDSNTEDCQDVIISRCFFQDIDQEAVRFSNSERITVKHNHFLDCAKDGGNLSHVLLNSGCVACLVQGNDFRATAVIANAYGVDVGASSRIRICDNDFYQLETAIWMEKVANTLIAITGNIFNSCGKAGVDSGVIELGTAATQAPNHITIAHNQFYSSQRRDIENSCTTVAATDLVIVNNLFSNNSQDTGDWPAVALGRATDSIVKDNIFETCGKGVIEGASSDRNSIEDNFFRSTVSTVITEVGANSVFRNNKGYTTENTGTGSIANGATSAVITHALAYTPTRAHITITLGENPTNTPGAIWVDTITATQFTVNCENDPGASNLDFSWAVRRV